MVPVRLSDSQVTSGSMCGRFGRLSRAQRIAQLTVLSIHNEAGELQQSYNVAPGTLQPVILNTYEGAVMRPLLWGLVPYWAQDPKKGARPVNARAESAAGKPMFRKLIAQAPLFIESSVTHDNR